MRKIDELRLRRKELAAEIRTAKAWLKTAPKDPKVTLNEYSWAMFNLHTKKVEARHLHIAYCELMGKTREQIEPKVREGHAPDQSQINHYKALYAWEIPTQEALT